MNIAVIAGYLQKLDRDGAAEAAKVCELMAQIPKEQREQIFGYPIPREQVVQKLRALPVPEDLKEILIDAWPKNYCGTPPLEFFNAESVVSHMQCKHFDAVIRAGFLPIGKAGNGDLVVTSFNRGSDYPVGFLNHSELYSSDDGEVAAAHRPIESSFERFLFRCVNGLELPGDSYDEWSLDELTKPLKPRPWWKFWG